MNKKIRFFADYKQTEKSSSGLSTKFVIGGVYIKALKYLNLMAAYAHPTHNKSEDKLYSAGISLLSKPLK